MAELYTNKDKKYYIKKKIKKYFQLCELYIIIRDLLKKYFQLWELYIIIRDVLKRL